MAQTPFTLSPSLTAVAIEYGNRRGRPYIADQISPIVPVATPDFRYTTYPMAEAYTVPDARVGRKSRPNEITLTGVEATGSVVDYGLDAPVPNRDIEAARTTQFNPLNRATREVVDKVDLAREIRVANMVFGAGNYVTGQKQTLAGTGAGGQWSATDSDPIAQMLDALDAMGGMRGNTLVLGQAVWSQLARNNSVGTRLGGSAQTGRMTAPNELAAALGLDRVIVGNSLYQTTKRGQTVATAPVWGKHAALIYTPPAGIEADGTPAFSLTFQWGDRVAGTILDPDMGLDGGVRVRSGYHLVEQVIAPLSGYLFTNAVA